LLATLLHMLLLLCGKRIIHPAMLQLQLLLLTVLLLLAALSEA
jgi:hypothetical protein